LDPGHSARLAGTDRARWDDHGRCTRQDRRYRGSTDHQRRGDGQRSFPTWLRIVHALRHTLDVPPLEPVWETDDEPVESVSQLDPATLQYGNHFGFVVQWRLLGVTWSPVTEDGRPGVHLRAPDGSRASVLGTPTNGDFPVSQAGPQRLWDQVEEAYTFWAQAGRPSSDRFGITATATEQYVWYDHPDSEHRWPLPAPPVYP
ncbi:MAG TPA: hypothetical protein VHH34_11705, partial [Pseudonocardiaceae bacterium]|nr:hypothetical protein [Pseudonocardiaceae bacterium]